MSVPYFGDFPEDHTHVIIPINTFSSNDPSASVTVTNLLNTDVHIHKDGAVAQRNNAAGITMTVDFDGITGNHVLIIDTSDNTVAGFYVTGKEYQVRIEGATVDAGAINAFVGTFSIERAGGVLALLKAGTVDVNTKTITAGIIANASFNADVGSTAHGTNIIALACRKILEELNLDHLLKVATGVAADGDLENFCVAQTVMAHLMAAAADATAYKASTDSMQAMRDHIGDGTNLTEAGGTGNHLTALAQASVLGALNNVAADGDPTDADTLMQYLKQLINILIGTAGIPAFPAEAAPANAVSLAEVIRAIHVDTSSTLDTLVKDIPTTAELALRTLLAADYTVVGDLGTVQSGDSFTIVNGAHGLVSIQDDIDLLVARITALIATKAEMDTAHALLATEVKQDIIDTNIDQIETAVITNAAGTDIAADIIALDTVADAIKVITDALTAAAATKLALSAGTIVAGTVSHDNTAASTTVFYSDDITEATADHYNGRIVIFTSGALIYQATDITDYALDTGEGKFSVTALTEAPADNVTFVIV